MEKKEINNKQEIFRLKELIHKQIFSVIDNDYVLWDLPYHKNIGDTLIWQGELDFLKETDHRMLDFGSKHTAKLINYDPSVVICLQGGGNFGDIYRSSQDFRNKVLQIYSKNKIILFPQSIHYNTKKYLEIDKAIINKHPNLYLCLRDNASYAFAKEHFPNANILLVPDMAFYISPVIYNQYIGISNSKRDLFFKRVDEELVDINYDSMIPNISNTVIADWPTFNKMCLNDFIGYSLVRINRIIGISKVLNDFFYLKYRKYLLKKGFEFLSNYDKVYSTRLHGFIASFLLNKKVFLLDNSYRKLNNFYDTWLTENINVKVISDLKD